MSRDRDTGTLDPITEEIRPWPPPASQRHGRPVARSSPWRRLFPRGWRDAMCAAWTLAGFLLCAVLAAAGWDLLAAIGRHG